MWMPFVDFVIRYDYIIEELCENREKPKIMCHGKCHLTKELQKQEEKKKQETFLEVHGEEHIHFPETLLSFSCWQLIQHDFVTYQNHYQFLWIRQIPHPPPFC